MNCRKIEFKKGCGKKGGGKMAIWIDVNKTHNSDESFKIKFPILIAIGYKTFLYKNITKFFVVIVQLCFYHFAR